ncbi:MAG: glutathione-dependent reductase [Verrucomicrobiales bacterium]|nr:glutathione-dependent reductase [Verrucomicrobiales bacterium]
MAQFPNEQSDDGSFDRQEDAFRDWVEDYPDAAFPVEKNRYHLYVCYACPWAHRIIIARELLGLSEAISMSAVDPIRNEEDGWAFRDGDGHGPDPTNGFQLLKEAYLASDPEYQGRVTVPVLWDKKEKCIVTNSDDDLLRMLNKAFRSLASSDLELVPEERLDEIDELNEIIYEHVNNGVYKAGFATSQKSYEEAVIPLFETLDMLEEKLASSVFLFGENLTETDIRLFVTLIRFDPVYHGHFKCNIRRIVDYPNLSRFVDRFRSLEGVEATINFDHIKRHYYVTHDDINPTGIVPVGPDGALTFLAGK